MEFLHWWLSTSPKMAKDRKERELSYEDILHYKNHLRPYKTDELMKKIDDICFTEV